MITLEIQKRDDTSKPSDIRSKGRIPAVFYGPKETTTSITISTPEFKKVWKKAGESSVIILKDSSGNELEALIHDLDVHPVTGDIRHADFYVIEKGKKVEVSVPLNFIGTAPAVKDIGGILVKVHREVEIEAAPKDLPHELEVDISSLAQLTDVICAKEIKLPTGVTLRMDPEEVVASISEAKEEAEEPVAPIDVSTIEVEAKGKEVNEDEVQAESNTPNKPETK